VKLRNIHCWVAASCETRIDLIDRSAARGRRNSPLLDQDFIIMSTRVRNVSI
jgi:hypothetical protein